MIRTRHDVCSLVSVALVAVAAILAAGCAGGGPAVRTSATTGDLVDQATGIIHSGIPDTGPCTDLYLLADDRTGQHPTWLGAVADSVARALRREGVRAYTGRRPVGVDRAVRLTSEMRGSSLDLRLTLDPGAVGLGTARIDPPPEEETPRSRQRFRDRTWVAGPPLPWPVLDARIVRTRFDGFDLAVLSPDGVRVVGFGLTDATLEVRVRVGFGAGRHLAAPADYGLLWWAAEGGAPTEGAPQSRELRVAASFLRSVGAVATTSDGPVPAGYVPLAPSSEVRLGSAGGTLGPNGIGVVLESAPPSLADLSLTGWAESDGVFLAIDREGNLRYGDRRGLWARPAPGYGPTLLPFDDGYITTRDTPTGPELIHAVIAASRRLEVTDHYPLGAVAIAAVESGDLNDDGRADLLMVATDGDGDRLMLFLSEAEATR